MATSLGSQLNPSEEPSHAQAHQASASQPRCSHLRRRAACGGDDVEETGPSALNEFNAVPAVQGAPAGKVTFTVTNTGKIEHEFVVVRTVRPAGSLTSHGGEASEIGNVGEIGSVKPGQQKKLTLTLKKGHYSLLCNLPAHYKSGQFVDFYVR